MSKRKTIGYGIKKAVVKRDNAACQLCGKIGKVKYGLAYEEKENRIIRFEFDHIIPLSAGGATVIENLQLLCRKCNRLKGSRV